MYSVSNIATKWGITSAYASAAEQSTDAFSLMMERLKKNGASAQDTFLDILGSRFPKLTFKTVTSAEGAGQVADGDDGDQVLVESEAAEELLASSTLMEQLQKALGAFSEFSGLVQPLNGAFVQHSFSITVISVRVSFSQISSETGETLSSSELQTAFSDRLAEMIRKFYGMEALADEENGEIGETAATDTAERAVVTESLMAGASFSFFFSMTSMQTLANIDGGSSEWYGSSAQFFMGVHGGFKREFLPSMIATGMQSAEFGSGPFTSMLNGALERFGLMTESMWQNNSGYFLKLRESRNLIAELMNLYRAGSAADESVAAGEEADAV